MINLNSSSLHYPFWANMIKHFIEANNVMVQSWSYVILMFNTSICEILAIFKKGTFLYRAVSNPSDCSERSDGLDTWQTGLFR